MDKEQFLIELEHKFDNSSWHEIMLLVNEVKALDIRDEIVDSIVDYVNEKNRISFKQWKVLRHHVNYHTKKKRKYKYGNQ
jgi:hypothetical protein